MTAMSPACLPPVQPATTADERAHPRYPEYARYRNALTMQLVTAPPFSSWLREAEEIEQPRAVIFTATPDARQLAPGWYVNFFRAGSRRLHARLGPYATRELAAATVPFGYAVEVVGA